MGIVSVMTSGKGGVGKSTLTAGLGTVLARRGRRVLMVDADAGLPSLDYLLGVSRELLYDLSDVVTGNCEPARAVYASPIGNGLFLLPAPQHCEDVLSPEVMAQVIHALSPYYDHVLIDCPAGLGGGFRAAVAPASRALIVSTPDPVCLRDTEKVSLALGEEGPAERKLIINRFQPKSFAKMGGFEDLDAVIDASGLQLAAIIPEDGRCAASIARGEPPRDKLPAMRALGRLASRMEGEQVPLAAEYLRR